MSADSFLAEPEHQRLQRLAGPWRGEARTWLHPGAPPQEAPWEGTIAPVLGGRFVRFVYRSSMGGSPFEGELLFGFDKGESLFTVTWIDTFHTGTAVMSSTGPRSEGAIEVKGTYFIAPGEPRWGWRTVVEDGERDALTIRMYNGTPDGQEMLGVEIALRRGG